MRAKKAAHKAPTKVPKKALKKVPKKALKKVSKKAPKKVQRRARKKVAGTSADRAVKQTYSDILAPGAAARRPVLRGFIQGSAAQNREAAANRFGRIFASKATDRLCEALVRPQFVSLLARPEIVSPIILETHPERPNRITTGPDTRLGRMRSLRDQFAQRTAGMKAVLDRKSKRPAPGRLKALAFSAETPPSPMQICWLNGTMRVRAHPQDVAEVASENMLAQLDLPRPLRPDLDVTSNTVGAARFRARFSLVGAPVIVAVVDFEIDVKHPALSTRVLQKLNLTKEPWGSPGAHGTAVAGIIASADATLSGMAPGVTILNYKVMCTDDSLNGDDFDGALAIQHALEDGAQIANCSWGAGLAGDGSSREAVACNNAWDLGLVIVKSAGNHGPGPSTLTSPADADGVIVVGATSRDGRAVADYSSRGPAGAKQRPHLVAPGGGEFDFVNSCDLTGRFGPIDFGTSFAAPHVSGLAALLLAQTPDMTPDDVRKRLLNACTPLPGLDANAQGRGLVSLA